MRQCGGCTLCCKLMPVREIGKPANTRCTQQRTGKGCTIYNTPAFPPACRLWSCKWIADPETADLQRPDRAHYVIDMMPDFITMQQPGKQDQQLPVVQIWCDPKHPDAHRDPALRDYLNRNGQVALVRYNSHDGFAIFPPSVTGFDDWWEQGGSSGPQHSFGEILNVVEVEQ